MRRGLLPFQHQRGRDAHALFAHHDRPPCQIAEALRSLGEQDGHRAHGIEPRNEVDEPHQVSHHHGNPTHRLAVGLHPGVGAERCRAYAGAPGGPNPADSAKQHGGEGPLQTIFPGAEDTDGRRS